MARDGHKACNGEHVRKRKFCDRVRAGLRRIADSDALLFRILDIDVINADAAADHKLQFAGFERSVDVRLAHLCRTAHDEHVILLDRFLQRFGIEILTGDFAALCFERRDGAFFHTVGCKNLDHVISPFGVMPDVRLRTSSGTRPALPRPLSAWRYRSKRAGRRRSCGP